METKINNALSVFSYNGNQITFRSDNGIMVNATEMAKAFNKRPIDYLRLPSTNELISAYVRKSHISENQLVMTLKGSSENGGGTWLHEDIALDFAQWLSIDFKLWCNDRIKELLTQGVTTVSNEDEVIAQAMHVLQKRLDASKQQVQVLQGENDHLQEENQKLAPKAKYTDEVLQSTSTYTLTQIAHDLGLRSVTALTTILYQKGVLYKQSGQWQPTAKVADKGYFATRTFKYVKSDSTIGTSISTVVTETGRVFLRNLINKLNAQTTKLNALVN